MDASPLREQTKRVLNATEEMLELLHAFRRRRDQLLHRMVMQAQEIMARALSTRPRRRKRSKTAHADAALCLLFFSRRYRTASYPAPSRRTRPGPCSPSWLWRPLSTSVFSEPF